MDSSMQKQSNPNSSMQRRQDIHAEALPCKDKIAMQRLRRCSQSEDNRSFHAAEEINRHVAADGNVRASGDVGGGLGKSYLFCLTARPPWKRLSRR